MRISDIVQRGDTGPGRVFDGVVLGLIALSIVIVSIDTMPELSPSFRQILHISETVITGCRSGMAE